jgi:hypothetical protein
LHRANHSIDDSGIPNGIPIQLRGSEDQAQRENGREAFPSLKFNWRYPTVKMHFLKICVLAVLSFTAQVFSCQVDK